jgi:hypothetical protein
MKTHTQKTTELMTERKIAYSPEAFKKIYLEVSEAPENIKAEIDRETLLNSNAPGKANRFTAYGMNKRPY